MGPFVPEIISDQLNLIVALLLGLAFGFVLEQAGFSSSRRLAGLFYGYDFTVLRVFFTAAMTAMAGIMLLGFAGLLDTEAIFVNPLWLWPTLAGGAVLGVGFILGGYCPGTSVSAAAIGKVDSYFFLGGIGLGVFAFAEFYPQWQEFYLSSALGPLLVFDSLGMSAGVFALILIAFAVGAFAVTSIIEQKVSAFAPSHEFNSRRHIAAGVTAVLIGVVLVGLPDRKTYVLELVSEPEYAREHAVELMPTDELAFRLVDHEPSILLIDVRAPGDYAALKLPGAVNVQLRELFAKEWDMKFALRHQKKVLIGNDEADARTAYFVLEKLGYENLAVLEGGISKFRKEILEDNGFVGSGGRHDAEVAEFRAEARVTINRMIGRCAQ
ncbi:MAG: YeeE/YedE family protein [bacterium]|nr:YeeE/YedE family protein [bacterium]